MMTKALAVAVPLALLFALPANAAGVNMKPGLWEVVAVIDTGPNVKRTVTSRICYNADDMKDAIRVVPHQQELGMKCEISDFKNQGDTSTWKESCTSKTQSVVGTGTMTMKPDSFTASLSVDQKGGAAPKGSKAGEKPGKVQESLTGKYISDCK